MDYICAVYDMCVYRQQVFLSVGSSIFVETIWELKAGIPTSLCWPTTGDECPLPLNTILFTVGLSWLAQSRFSTPWYPYGPALPLEPDRVILLCQPLPHFILFSKGNISSSLLSFALYKLDSGLSLSLQKYGSQNWTHTSCSHLPHPQLYTSVDVG